MRKLVDSANKHLTEVYKQAKFEEPANSLRSKPHLQNEKRS